MAFHLPVKSRAKAHSADWTINVFLFHFLIHALAQTSKVTTAGRTTSSKRADCRTRQPSSLEINRPEATLLCTSLKDTMCILRLGHREAGQTWGRWKQGEVTVFSDKCGVAKGRSSCGIKLTPGAAISGKEQWCNCSNLHFNYSLFIVHVTNYLNNIKHKYVFKKYTCCVLLTVLNIVMYL